MNKVPSIKLTTANENEALVYKGVGHVFKALHEALTWVGADDILAEASNEFPSARARLQQIAVLAERAANTVLNKVEQTLPLQQQLSASADTLAQQWAVRNIEQLSKEELQILAQSTREYIADTQAGYTFTEQALGDIMISQDFQDLTGQLIKKVVSLLERTETDLLHLLISGAPEGSITASKKEDLLAGPGAVGGIMMVQNDVDDLLADLGF